MYNFFTSPEMNEDGMNDYVDAAVQQTGATAETMDDSDQTDQMNQPTAPAAAAPAAAPAPGKDEKADPEAMDTDEGYKVDLNMMKMNVVEGEEAPTWSGPTSSASKGDVIYNIAGPAYDYCMTNVNTDSLQDGIYVRQPYIDLYDKILSRLTDVQAGKKDATKKKSSKPKRPALIHICGTPMIGKTMFLYYVMTRLCEEENLEIPGFVIIGIIPCKTGEAVRYYSVAKLDKKSMELHFEEESTNNPEQAFDSKLLRSVYKGYIFLIDNAKRDELGISLHNNTIIFASPKVEDEATDCKFRIDTWYMPVWDRDEIDDLVLKMPHALPEGDSFKDYDGMAKDLDKLMYFFGGTLGNILHDDRGKRARALLDKANHLIGKKIAHNILTSGQDYKIDATYSSLIKVVLDDYAACGTIFISPFFIKKICKAVEKGEKECFKLFWKSGAEYSPTAYGNCYEEVIAGFLGKNGRLEMEWVPHLKKTCLENLTPGKQTLENVMHFEFENANFHVKKKEGPYCVEEQRLARMWKNCKSMDFYTIQKRKAKNDRPGDDVQDRLATEDHNVADGYPNGYDVVVWQTTVGESHKEEFTFVIKRLVNVEEAVVKAIKDPAQAGGTHMKNSLLSGSVSIWFCYLQPYLRPEFKAPCQEDVPKTSANTRANASKEIKLRDAIQSKIQIIYGVANPLYQMDDDVKTDQMDDDATTDEMDDDGQSDEMDDDELKSD